MAAVTRLKLSAQPNAGRPRDVEGRNIYLCSPEYMASYARRFVLHNVRIVGGCCGTTPEHIRQIKAAVRGLRRSWAPSSSHTGLAMARAEAGIRHASPRRGRPCRASRSRGSRMRWRAARSSSASSCCRRAGTRPSRSSSGARRLKIRGVDVVNIPDGQRAGARLSALSLAVLIEQQAGVETLLHYSCRDRNLLGIQSDLLGAHAMGLRNVLLITGDPGRVGDYPDATGRVRRRLDRPHQRRRAAESRLRRRRPADRRADRLPHRRVGQSRGAQPRRGAAAVRVQGRGRRRVRRHAADLRPGRLRGVLPAHRIGPASGRGRRISVSKARGTPSSWRTRCPASACRMCWSSGCAGPKDRDGAAAEGI